MSLVLVLSLLVVDTVRVIQPARSLSPIELVSVSTLQGDSLAGIMTTTIAARDLIVAGEGTPLYRFALETGRLLGTLTRTGDGPGETRRPLYLETMPGDSVFLYDEGLRRATVYAPGTYRTVRTMVVPGRGPSSVFPHRGGLLVATRTVPAEGAGQLLHEFDWSGRWRRSYGNPSERLGNRPVPRLIAVPSAEGGIWTVTQSGPVVLEHFDANGRRTARFIYGTTSEPQSRDDGPRPARVSLWEESPGRLWLVTVVADQRFEEGMKPVDGGLVHGRAARALTDPPKAFDSVVDLIDMRTATLVARQRIDGLAIKVLPGGYLVVDEENRPTGEPRFTVNRLPLADNFSRR